MKKALFFSAAAFALLGASCSQEDAPRIGDDNAAFRVSIPAEISTRYGEAATAPSLYVAIYKHSESTTDTPTILFSNFPDNLVNADQFTVGDFGAPNSDNLRTATVNVDLVKNEKYDIICWAQQENVTTYTFSPTDQTITVAYTNEAGTANTIDNYDEDRDAFFGQMMGYTSEGKGDDITLKRPFAQINVGTSDWQKYLNAGGDKNNPFGMTISGAATTLNLTNGTVSGTAEDITVTGAAAQPYKADGANNFPVTTGEYTYLDMAYILVGDMGTEKGNLTVGLTGLTGYPEWTEVPAKMNYRTNIYGNLLTNAEDFTITLDPNFGKPDILYIVSGAQLMDALETGGEFALQDDVTLPKEDIVVNPEKPFTLDLGNHTLYTSSTISVANGASCTITGEEGSRIVAAPKSSPFNVYSNSKLEVDGVDMSNSSSASGAFTFYQVQGQDFNLTVKNCTLTPQCYAFATNATDPTQSGDVYMENVTIQATENSGTPVMCNIPINFTAVNCHFEGILHGFLMRGGNYDFTNCSFELKIDMQDDVNVKEDIAKYRNIINLRGKGFGTGNTAVISGVTMGNHDTSSTNEKYYLYATTVNMKGCSVIIPDIAMIDEMGLKYSLPAVYAYANQTIGDGVYFTYDAATTFKGAQEYASPNIFVNGVETQNYDFKTDEPK